MNEKESLADARLSFFVAVHCVIPRQKRNYSVQVGCGNKRLFEQGVASRFFVWHTATMILILVSLISKRVIERSDTSLN